MDRCRWRRAAGALAAAALAALAALPAGAWAQPAQPAQPQVQPSADHVPANLLRISLVFPAPVDGGVLPRLALVAGDGAPVDAPFLPQELWSSDGTILTLLLHPGRVKTGLRARAALGPILRAGDSVTLTLDGRPLHRWQVDPDDAEGPVVAAWRIAPVAAGTRRALMVTLDGPVDGRAAGHIAVADGRGRRLPGAAALAAGETRWTFTPARPWRPGRYRLVVRATLEDPAGNRAGGRFEMAPDGAADPAADAARTFTVPMPAPAHGRRPRS